MKKIIVSVVLGAIIASCGVTGAFAMTRAERKQQIKKDRELFKKQHSQKSTAGRNMKFDDFKLH